MGCPSRARKFPHCCLVSDISWLVCCNLPIKTNSVICADCRTMRSLIDVFSLSWIIHISSLVEFLVAMGFAWRWADVVGNPKWKGLTWGLLPLHSSGITACTYHLFYNEIPILVPLQAFLTCVGNITAAYATYRIAVSNGWTADWADRFYQTVNIFPEDSDSLVPIQKEESPTLVGFEDLGDALAKDTDYTFIVKLFAGCALASYALKYGEILFQFPFDANVYLSVMIILVPSLLNAFKWYKRSQDPTFEGWF
mmetsp:Transcript_11003/g.32590  ORF Transcript_11003/g.32590 Transcript_11003/m.32590 type:complete len:253 (-) Transcript_11003:166-924(-)